MSKSEPNQSKNPDMAVRARHRAQNLALYLYKAQKKIEVIHRSRIFFRALQSWQAKFHKNPLKIHRNPSKIHRNPWNTVRILRFLLNFDGFSQEILWNVACQLWGAVKSFLLLWITSFFFWVLYRYNASFWARWRALTAMSEFLLWKTSSFRDLGHLDPHLVPDNSHLWGIRILI